MTSDGAHSIPHCVSLRAPQATEHQDWQGPWHGIDIILKSVQALWYLPDLCGNLWCWDSSPTIGRGQHFCWRALPRRGKHLSMCGTAFRLPPSHRMKTSQALLQVVVASEMQAERFCNSSWYPAFEDRCHVHFVPSSLSLHSSCHWQCGGDGWSSRPPCHLIP